MSPTRVVHSARMGRYNEAICISIMLTLITYDLNRFQVGSGATASDPQLPAQTAAKPQQQSAEPNTLNLKSIHSDTTSIGQLMQKCCGFQELW